jgi:hypothetical protein
MRATADSEIPVAAFETPSGVWLNRIERQRELASRYTCYPINNRAKVIGPVSPALIQLFLCNCWDVGSSEGLTSPSELLKIRTS